MEPVTSESSHSGRSYSNVAVKTGTGVGVTHPDKLTMSKAKVEGRVSTYFLVFLIIESQLQPIFKFGRRN